MSFVAAISDAARIGTWSRACVALAGVADQIAFTVRATSLSMLAVNSSKTTHGEVHFEQGFFNEIAFSAAGVLEDGYCRAAGAYSFVVSSKHLVMLLKNSDAASLNYVCLQVECSTHTPAVRRYKLGVEILTKKLVLKKYQIGFQPVEVAPTDIPARYETRARGNDVFQYLVPAATFKQFLDTAHAAAEDFGVEAKAGRIAFEAYTKLVLRDRDCLKQPMLVTMQMAVADLARCNLADAGLAFTFRLRDFRIFVGLVSGRPGLAVDTLCPGAGLPALFQHRGTDVTVNFIQMTTGARLQERPPAAHGYALHAPVVQKKRPLAEGPGAGAGSAARAKKTRPAREGSLDVFEPRVSYGAPGPGLASDTPAGPDDTEYSSSAEEPELEYGPTQARDRPEPLFQ